MTIELVDAPVVLESARKSDALTRFGNADTPSKSGTSGFPGESLLIAAGHADETDIPAATPEWIQTKGPGGVSSAGLFLASDQTLYAIAKTGLFRLSEQEDAWTFVSASGSNREFSPVMAERGDTLYLLTSHELLVSIDEGQTWNSLGARKTPQGRAIALVITDAAMYLVLQTEVFRSEDIGNQWKPIEKGLQADNLPEGVNPNFRIWDALAIDNTLFVGTSHGLFRWTDDWEKLPVPTLHGIKSLATDKDRLYVGTIASSPHGPHAAVFYSTDLGDFWIDITPNTHEYPVKLITTVEVVPLGDVLMLMGVGGVLRSDDGGETWTDPGGNAYAAYATVALDENNLYNTYHAGITRSTDGGITWQPFMIGMVNSHVPSLVAVENVLYAVTAGKIVTSKDGSESWETVNVSGGDGLLIPRMETMDTTLYVSSIADNRTQLFHLSVGAETLIPIQDMPDFEEDNLYIEWKKRLRKARETNIDVRETEQLWQESLHNIAKEDITNGGFIRTGETVFMEHRRKLFRWRRGETVWHDTGLEDQGPLSPIDGKGFTLAALGNTVYAGKRDGFLFLSLDDGDTWNDITENLFPFGYFKEILFAGSTVYVSTDMGVMSSHDDGKTWHALTDVDGNRLVMDRMAVKGAMAYGACDSGVYQVDNQANTWRQITPKLPHTATSFAIEGDTFYIGTKQYGVLRFQGNHP